MKWKKESRIEKGTTGIGRKNAINYEVEEEEHEKIKKEEGGRKL